MSSIAILSPRALASAPVHAARRMELLSIQYLRAVAALMVVAFHVKPRLLRMGYDGPWPEWLGCGVDIFFVISGAIMWLTTYDRAVSPQDFLFRRFLRIAPLYYIVTILVVALMVAAPALVIGGRLDTMHVLASFAFLPWPHPLFGTFEPVLPQGWTLNYEMLFYLLFAASLFVRRSMRPWLVVGALCAIVLAGRNSDPASVAGFFSSSIILEFAFGLLIGVVVTAGVRLPRALAIAFLALGLVGIPATWPLVIGGVPRVWLCGASAALLVAGAVFLELQGVVFRNRVMHLLGDASYSIYLTHGLAMSAIGAVWMRAGLATHTPTFVLFVPVSIAVATLAGVITYRIAEKPLHDLSRNLVRRRAATA